VEKSSPRKCATSGMFKNLPKEKKLPNGRKIAQSGHPGKKESDS
jgi:hypothetical protein